MNNYYINVVK